MEYGQYVQVIVPIAKLFVEYPQLVVPMLGGVATGLIGLPLLINKWLQLSRFNELKNARNVANLSTGSNLATMSKVTPVAVEFVTKTRPADEVIAAKAKADRGKPQALPKR